MPSGSMTLGDFGITVIPKEKVNDLPEMDVKFLKSFPTAREAIDFAHAEFQKDETPLVILKVEEGKFSVWKEAPHAE